MRKALLFALVVLGLGLLPGEAGAVAPAGPRLAVSSLSFNLPSALEREPKVPDLADLLSGDLLTVDPLGEARQKLIGSSGAAKLTPLGGLSWSPDGSTLAFQASKLTSFKSAGRSDIYLIGADGTGLRRLTHLRNAYSPVFSSDGSTIYFERPQHLPKNAFARLERKSSGKKGDKGNPSQSIAFLLGGTSSIWAIAIDGSGLHRVSPADHGVSKTPTSVSPLTGDLAFTWSRCGRHKCANSARLLSVQSGAETVIANHAAAPVFSPDGQTLALESYQDHNWRKHSLSGPAPELYVRTLASGEMRRLTFSRGVTDGPAAWDPSGRRLAYLRAGLNRNGVSEINPDGTCATPLPTLQGVFLFGPTYDGLAWQPGADRGAGPAVC